MYIQVSKRLIKELKKFDDLSTSLVESLGYMRDAGENKCVRELTNFLEAHGGGDRPISDLINLCEGQQLPPILDKIKDMIADKMGVDPAQIVFNNNEMPEDLKQMLPDDLKKMMESGQLVASGSIISHLPPALKKMFEGKNLAHKMGIDAEEVSIQEGNEASEWLKNLMNSLLMLRQEDAIYQSGRQRTTRQAY